MTNALVAAISKAQKLALGLRKDRTPSKPTKTEDGTYTGGTHFERDDHALNVHNAPRCYTLAQSYQVQRNLVGPAAGAKIAMGENPTEHLLLRQQIIEVCVLLRLLPPGRSLSLLPGGCAIGHCVVGSSPIEAKHRSETTGRRHKSTTSRLRRQLRLSDDAAQLRSGSARGCSSM